MKVHKFPENFLNEIGTFNLNKSVNFFKVKVKKQKY